MNTITRTANNNLPAYFLGRPRSAYRVYRRPRRADAPPSNSARKAAPSTGAH